jgi:predicted TIM-barrel fold metal-dependent hydrolase
LEILRDREMTVVDFHSYFQPEEFLDHLRRRKSFPRIEKGAQGDIIFSGPGAGRLIRPEQTDLVARLRLMDEAGVDVQILRLQNVGGIDAFEIGEASAVARSVNGQLAAIARRFPDRFVPFAAVPLMDTQRAIDELRYAVEKLGHRGVGVSCHIDGIGLDDPRFAEFLQAVEALRVPLLLLPNHPPLLEPALRPYGWLAGAFGFQVDLSWAALRLLASGVMDRLPELKVIVANLGGVLTSITERLDEYWRRVNAGTTSLGVPPSRALQRFYFETASASPRAIALAAEIFGADRLLFGSDYPSFELAKGVRNVLESGLGEAELRALFHENARALLPDAALAWRPAVEQPGQKMQVHAARIQ